MPKQGLSGAPTSPSQHQYEVPRSPPNIVRMPQQQQYSQDQRPLHQDERVLRLDPEREKPKKHYFGPSSTSTPQRQTEARALPPDFGSPQMESWEREMLRNINALSVTGGMTKLQSEFFVEGARAKKTGNPAPVGTHTKSE